MQDSQTKPTALNVSSAVILLIVMCVGLNWNTFDAQFVYDDSRAIISNSDLHIDTPWTDLLYNDFWGVPITHSGSHRSYRPLTVATFRLNYLFTQLEPYSYHIVNMLLHSIVCSFYFIMLLALSGQIGLNISFSECFLSSLLYAAHPIHCEAVAGVVGRADTLAALFYIQSILACVWSMRQRHLLLEVLGLLGVGLMTGLAMLSKETGITSLGVCALIEVLNSKLSLIELFSLKKIPNRRSLVRIIYMGSLTVGLLYSRMLMMGGTPPKFATNDNPAAASKSIVTRFLTFSYLPVFNFWLLLCPSTLNFDWSMESIPLFENFSDYRNIYSMLFYIGVITISLPQIVFFTIKRLYREYTSTAKHTAMATTTFALSLIVIPFIPACNIFFYVGFVVAERILYIPSMGFCLLIILGYSKICKYIPNATLIMRIGLYLLLVVHCVKTVRRNLDWHDEESIYRSGIEINPAKSLSNLANVLKMNGDMVGAEEAYRNSLSYKPNMANSHYNLGILLQESERFDEAIESYKAAITCRPQLASAYLNLGKVYVKIGQLQKAEDIFTQCAGLSDEGLKDPKTHANSVTSCLFSHGQMKFDTDKFENAIHIFEACLKTMPLNYISEASVYNLMGETYSKLNEVTRAEENFKKSLQVKPYHIPTILNYSKFLKEIRKYSQAERLLVSSYQLNPQSTYIIASLAQLYMDLGRKDESIEYFDKATSIQSESNDFQIFASAADAYRSAGLLEKALEMYSKAKLLAPNNANNMGNYAALLHILKRYDEAEVAYQEAIQLDPASILMKENYAKLKKSMRTKA